MKICGLDYFGLDDNNKVIMIVESFVDKFHLTSIWSSITLYIYTYITLSITCVDNSKQMKLFTLCILPIAVGLQLLRYIIVSPLFFVVLDLLWVFMVSLVYIIFIKKTNLKRHNVGNYWLFMFINLLFQIISLVIRDIDIQNDYTNFIASFICNFDYLILSIMFQNLFFRIGGNSLCHGVAYLFSHLLTLLKSLPTKLQNVYVTNKSKSKFDKVSDAIYIPLYIIWNLFTVFVILFIAVLNNTIIECILILSSFWMNKTAFGKAFHMTSAVSCFIVSNISYYCLNRITLPVGVSLLISVLLGALLSYITSYFVKDKKLYRGMSLELFDETIVGIADKDSDEYKICKMFYVEKQSDQYIATKLNYSKSSIEKKKHNIVAKLKKS